MTRGNLEQKLSSFLPPSLSVDGLYSSLRHGSHQRYAHLVGESAESTRVDPTQAIVKVVTSALRPIAWSCKNVAIVPSWVPDRKVAGLMNPSLRMLSLLMCAEGKAKLWDTCMEDISMFHGQSYITHVLWSHSGSHFTSIDEKGKLVIWTNKRYLNAWLPVYMVVLHNPVVCCEWINPERMFVASKSDGPTKYERERTGRPRSPLALVVLTSDGQVDLRFTPEVVFRCDAVAILHITNLLTGQGSVMIPGSVQHLQLLPQTSTRPFSVAVALAAREEHSSEEIPYKSQVVVWDVAPKLMGFHPAFQELSTRRNDAVSGQPLLTFVLLGERRFENKFVSAMAYVPRSRELVVGFSDGSILGLDSRYSGLLDATSTLLDGFQAEKSDSPIVAISPSPNGFTLLYSSLSGQISSIETSETSGYDLDLEASVQCAVVALLNEWDYSDIVAVIVKAFRIFNDDQLPDRLLEGVFKSYETINGGEDASAIEPFMPIASIMRRMLAFQLVLCQALPHKAVQYRATCALLHLQSIGEVFSGCCTSDSATIAAHLDQGPNVTTGQKPLAFDTNSLWSLFPLCGWVLDFCTILFRELAIFLAMKSAASQEGSSVVSQSVPDGQNSKAVNPSSTAIAGTLKPSLLCFLYHSRSRKTLRSVLVLVEQYYQYVKIREQLCVRVYQTNGAIEGPTGQGQEKANHTNSMSIPDALAMKDIQIVNLSLYVEATFSRCPVKIAPAKSMLRDLNGIGGHAVSDYAIFIKGTIPSPSSNALAQAKMELRMITRRYPTLWDMNRLIFATIHWLDLEPANKLMGSTAVQAQRAAAMHPSRCRIDPVAALKTRILGVGGMTLPSGRPPHPTLQQHHSSSVSHSNMSTGTRGSISSASGKSGIPSKVFSESPGELPLSQQAGQQLRTPNMSQPFRETSSTMVATGTMSHGGPLDLNNPGSLSIWGLALDDDDDYRSGDHRDEKEEEVEAIKAVWTNWSPALHGQQLGFSAAARSSNNSNEVGAETVPDDDVLEEEADDEEEDRDSDEDMQDATIGSISRRDSKNDPVRGRRSSVATMLTPSSLWLLQESQAISKKSWLEWTVFPLLSDERPCTGNDDSRGQMLEVLGVSGHFAPLDLQPTEFNAHPQADIEAQVRKRRFGVDPIRKVKKYKTTGHGRRCIRCLQISTNNSVNAKPVRGRALPHQIGTSPTVIPDIAAATLWYHNYDRSCICGGMWLEL
ncbi:hypothetical protein BGZ65_007683 [Modicella reniformis]|uniref:Mediator complex subunit 16 C-terminal domain-containing protein n=1 Tax=Modicella reniformis TaxID=1440133 RepID=A0A9P6MB02_9FUNG|nr:hypothetical protein BGZ65_007683 [Modicella reniformis]